MFIGRVSCEMDIVQSLLKLVYVFKRHCHNPNLAINFNAFLYPRYRVCPLRWNLLKRLQ
jgi:hypothetical protein